MIKFTLNPNRSDSLLLTTTAMRTPSLTRSKNSPALVVGGGEKDNNYMILFIFALVAPIL